ncbi:MAG: response regulator [Treponema sp.]|jgi:signal transduction histidine kinase/DNA-binding response OmpR family regulator/PAS domain-containing protein|nr:response regulator [Treponema sp.]
MFDTRIDPPIDADTLRIMLAASGTGLWDWHIDANTAYYSDEWLAIIGIPPGVFEPRIEFRLERMHPDDAASVKAEFDAFLIGESKGAPYIDFRMKCADGSWVQVRETVGITKRDSNGRPTRVTGMTRDNTIAKIREKRLEDERRYHISVESAAGFMVWEWDLASDSIIFNGTLKPFEKKSFKEFLQLVHPDDTPLYRQNLEEYLEKGEGNFEHVLRLMGVNNQYLWYMLHAVIVERDNLGKPAKLIGSTLNIDKNVRAEDALRSALEETIRHRERLMADIERSEESRKAMFKNSPHACIMFDSGFRVLDCNPAALELFEFTSEVEFRRDFVAFIAVSIPKRQPDGRLSTSLADRLDAAVRDGTHELETELLIRGKPCPLSVIIKKVAHIGSFVLMVYTVDLRKQRDMLMSLRVRDRLLETINKMAVTLMRSNNDINAVLYDAIAELGAGSDVDIAYVLKNGETSGELYCSVASSWTRLENVPLVPPPVPCDVILPRWRDTLAEGRLYNFRIAEVFKDPAKTPASMAMVKISLNIPLFVQNAFWGVIGLSRCDEDKPFIKAEEDLLQSAGILIASAITRSLMTETLLEANRAAIAGVQAKTNFLSHMSHEIRTPINAIIGMTTLAHKAADMQRVRYCLTQIENSSRQLLGIINNVLDMSKIEANKLEISAEEFVFENMMQHVLDVVQVKIDEKGQKFHVNMENTFIRAVISDELRLSQTLINLLANAIKFTPDGGKISLSVRQTPIDADAARLHVEIADTGIGITDEQKARLFRLFEQAESSATTRKYGGTGLGLSISKSIVNLMGGDIWVEDNPGGGSRFIFEVVIKWGKACRRDKLPKHLRRDLHILVVDDDKDVREYFKSILAGFSLECDAASGGAEAVALVERHIQDGKPYHLIFLDWMMPGMDGERTAIEIMRVMGGGRRGAALIVMISAANRSEISSTLDALGIANFLSKPILPSTLYNTIVDLLGYTGEPAANDEDETSSYDWSGKRVLLAEDVELNREIVIGILEDSGLTIECAENGGRAVEMFAKNEYDLVLMDIQMPIMDGYDATRAIRASGKPNAAVCPIIAMTANAFKEDVRECLAAGMNDHIAKPLDVKRLFATLSKYLCP